MAEAEDEARAAAARPLAHAAPLALGRHPQPIVARPAASSCPRLALPPPPPPATRATADHLEVKWRHGQRRGGWGQGSHCRSPELAPSLSLAPRFSPTPVSSTAMSSADERVRSDASLVSASILGMLVFLLRGEHVRWLAVAASSPWRQRDQRRALLPALMR